MTATTQAPPASKKAPMMRPFRVGVHGIEEEPFEKTVTTNASTQQLETYYPPSTGFLRGVWLLVEATTASNVANVTFAADGPWNVLDTIKFGDTGQSDIVGGLTGHELYIVNKYGGYAFSDDPKASPIYSATTGTGGTGGSFTFALYIPAELVQRDALGALVNKSMSTRFIVKTSVAATATIYGTAPTNAPSIRFRFIPDSYGQPLTADASGNPISQNPPEVDTTQYWKSQTYSGLNAGYTNPFITGSTGYPVRNLVFVLRDSNSSRSQGESDWPDPFQLKLDANIIFNRLKTMWKHQIARDYGYTAAVSDTTANAKDNGVYVKNYCKDFGPKPGWETRRDYLIVPESVRLQALGTIGGTGAHSLTVLTNSVAPAPGSSLARIQA